MTRWSGAFIAFLGILAIVAPFVAGLTLSIALGVLLIIAGITAIAHAFSAQGWMGFGFQVVLGVVYAIAGIALVVNPVLGLATLTILLVAFLVVDGVVELGMGLFLRDQPNRLGLLISGVLALVLAALIWVGLPSSAAWAVGLLFGVNLLATGLSMVFLARGSAEAEGSRLTEGRPPESRDVEEPDSFDDYSGDYTGDDQ